VASVPTVAPVLRYRDLDAAVAWLCTAFGLEREQAVAGAHGALEYAELRWGSALILVSKVAESELDALMRQPDQVGGAATQTSYLVVDDADAHCAWAIKGGAEIVLGVRDDAFGGRSYACRDIEGHIWNFGTHGPRSTVFDRVAPAPVPRRGKARQSRLAAGLLSMVAVGALVGAGWMYYRAEQAASSSERIEAAVRNSAAEIRAVHAHLDEERGLRRAAEQALMEASALLVSEREAKAAAQGEVKILAGALEAARMAETTATQSGSEARATAEEQARARAAAEQRAETLQAELERETMARRAAEAARADPAGDSNNRQALEALRAELAREVSARRSAEQQADVLLSERDEARRTRDAQAASATSDREALARERETVRQVTEQLAQEQAARQTAQAALHELSTRLAQTEGTGARAENTTDSLGATSAERPGARRASPQVTELQALQAAAAKPGPQAERARKRLRIIIATSRDANLLARFINTAEGSFAELARRRVQVLKRGHASRSQQGDGSTLPPAVVEQRELLEAQKAYTKSTP
jgi:uncharacterized glyoxalase superfamily protein PhnB